MQSNRDKRIYVWRRPMAAIPYYEFIGHAQYCKGYYDLTVREFGKGLAIQRERKL